MISLTTEGQILCSVGERCLLGCLHGGVNERDRYYVASESAVFWDVFTTVSMEAQILCSVGERCLLGCLHGGVNERDR
jgi:hypothetical protein